MLRPYYAEVNLDNIRHNINEVKRIVKDKRIIGVIKADAYGHGAFEVASVLKEEGVDFFAVAVVTEALQLRREGIQDDILVLGYTSEEFFERVLENNITLTIYNFDLAQKLNLAAQKMNKRAKVHIKIDTGMGRLGFQINEDGKREIVRICALSNLEVEGIYSHFACADEKDKTYSYLQLEKFNWMINELEKEGIKFKIRHIANSAGIIDLKESYFDAVRPGIMLYGYYPSDEINKDEIKLKPAMSLKAKVAMVKKVDKGTSISYGRRYIAPDTRIIATLPFGYADGFTRMMSGNAKVLIKGKEVEVVGRICMDQCMADVTDVEDVNIGDEVVVMGKSGDKEITADTIAARLNTISYEVLCMVSKRVPRVYIKNGEIIKIKNLV
ncbi:alanine racemase [Thermobrachium celere]|uniref:Alanine racemase n=1 Tax=Thermobrachium celere DSM 8682 TaxID=941824 RepID=R7RNT0_9CLOT|nr:alanine racemase [Thermobrachium celere]CDF57699.1 Alanine racemase [Thermobrachium celere DSM 8682]